MPELLGQLLSLPLRRNGVVTRHAARTGAIAVTASAGLAVVGGAVGAAHLTLVAAAAGAALLTALAQQSLP